MSPKLSRRSLVRAGLGAAALAGPVAPGVSPRAAAAAPPAAALPVDPTPFGPLEFGSLCYRRVGGVADGGVLRFAPAPGGWWMEAFNPYDADEVAARLFVADAPGAGGHPPAAADAPAPLKLLTLCRLRDGRLYVLRDDGTAAGGDEVAVPAGGEAERLLGVIAAAVDRLVRLAED